MKAALIVSGILFALFLFYNIGFGIKEYFYPTPPSPPTVSFGKLPSVTFPQNSFTSTSFQFTIDTLSGKLPAFPDRITVYKTISSPPNLLALERATQNATRTGFTTKPSRISDTQYLWNEQIAPLRKLQMDVLSLNFTVSSPYINDQDVVSAKNLPDQTNAIRITKEFLSSLGSTPKDSDANKTKTTLLTIQNGTLAAATSFSNTKIIRVNYYQKDINKLPVYYASSPFSSLNFLVASTQNGPQVVAADFFHQTVDENISATYPIKTAGEAFSLLKEGKGYISSSPTASGNIRIKNVTLGYYVGDTAQEFLVPVIVFEGNDFYGFVPAVKDEWLE